MHANAIDKERFHCFKCARSTAERVLQFTKVTLYLPNLQNLMDSDVELWKTWSKRKQIDLTLASNEKI